MNEPLVLKPRSQTFLLASCTARSLSRFRDLLGSLIQSYHPVFLHLELGPSIRGTASGSMIDSSLGPVLQYKSKSAQKLNRFHVPYVTSIFCMPFIYSLIVLEPSKDQKPGMIPLRKSEIEWSGEASKSVKQ